MIFASNATTSTDERTCQSCGACCAFSRDWPRFTTETDAMLDRLPGDMINADMTGMRCDGDRCTALVGEVGVSTSCAVYAERPEVCQACTIGDEACQMARQKYGLPPIAA